MEEHLQENAKDSELDAYARIVHKICGYYKWSYRDFRETPWWLIKKLSRELDTRQTDLNTLIGADEAAMLKNLRRLFPSKE